MKPKKLRDGKTPIEMSLNFVKNDVSAAICKMTETLLYIHDY